MTVGLRFLVSGLHPMQRTGDLGGIVLGLESSARISFTCAIKSASVFPISAASFNSFSIISGYIACPIAFCISVCVTVSLLFRRFGQRHIVCNIVISAFLVIPFFAVEIQNIYARFFRKFVVIAIFCCFGICNIRFIFFRQSILDRNPAVDGRRCINFLLHIIE